MIRASALLAVCLVLGGCSDTRPDKAARDACGDLRSAVADYQDRAISRPPTLSCSMRS